MGIVLLIITNMKTQVNRAQAALWGMYIGDALAMPAHWYYDTQKLKQDFGEIKKYEAPKSEFPDSKMHVNYSQNDTDIIGDVICHGKRPLWTGAKKYHYHHGLKAGENTLEALVTKVLMNNMTKNHGNFQKESFLADYVKFMTTPGSHNDPYASTSHRLFFQNYAKGKHMADCAAQDGHNVDSIDGLTAIIPIAVASFFNQNYTEDDKHKEVAMLVKSMRSSKILPVFGLIYHNLLVDLLKGTDLRVALQKTGMDMNFDVEKAARVPGDPMTACYIQSSFPVMLVYAYKYYNDPKKALLKSVNGGGENVSRGQCLGAIMGAAYGMNYFDQGLVMDLVKYDEIDKDVNAFLDVLQEKKAS